MHALTGAYAVVTDWEGFYGYRRAVAGVAILVGLVAFTCGTQTILAFQPPV